MDKFLGNIISDDLIYYIIERLILLMFLLMIYIGINVALTWKYLEKKPRAENIIFSQKKNLTRSAFYIFIVGLFIVLHEFLENLGIMTPDYVTFEFFQFISITALVLFLYEWYIILKKAKRKC